MGHAASLFNGAGEDTLHSRVTPTDQQRKDLQERWNDLAEHLKPALRERSGYEISSWIQGSYKFGTLIKPVQKGEEYDVDLGVYFHWRGSEGRAAPAPEQLREWVQSECEIYSSQVYDIKDVAQPPKERCSRLTYVAQFHIDVPAYHFDPETSITRLATLSKGWEGSDPEKLYNWFKDYVENPERDQLRRVIRYLKAWAALTFAPTANARPSSVLLTVLAADAFLDEHVADAALQDDDALLCISRNMLDRLSAQASVQNPVDEAENLNRIPASDMPVFLQALESLAAAGQRASEAADAAAAALAWSDALSFLMPLPEADVEVVDEKSGTALMALPEIRVIVMDSSGRQVANYMNEVPAVGKDCHLKFVVTNPAVIPRFATIEWTVRNHGKEAEAIGDLGHRDPGATGLETTEHTAYLGRHFMDCVVKLNGQTWAVRRIAVHIRPAPPPRNPARPAWAKLRSIRRR
jgi:hypothetical protein